MILIQWNLYNIESILSYLLEYWILSVDEIWFANLDGLECLDDSDCRKFLVGAVIGRHPLGKISLYVRLYWEQNYYLRNLRITEIEKNFDFL